MSMDRRYELNGIMFIWDESKARKNLAKHELMFEQAVEVFFDPFFRGDRCQPKNGITRCCYRNGY